MRATKSVKKRTNCTRVRRKVFSEQQTVRVSSNRKNCETTRNSPSSKWAYVRSIFCLHSQKKNPVWGNSKKSFIGRIFRLIVSMVIIQWRCLCKSDQTEIRVCSAKYKRCCWNKWDSFVATDGNQFVENLTVLHEQAIRWRKSIKITFKRSPQLMALWNRAMRSHANDTSTLQRVSCLNWFISLF